MDYISELMVADWIIIILSLTLVNCLLYILRLNKKLKTEIHKRTVPELNLQLDLDKIGLFIINTGEITAKDINIVDLSATISDYGYDTDFRFEFETVDELKPKEEKKLYPRVFQSQDECPPHLAEKITMHLYNTPCNVETLFSNTERIKFKTLFRREAKEFIQKKTEPIQ